MKAKEAPEKIYLNPLLMEDVESIIIRCTFERQRDSQVEYTRTDAFVEKAVEYIITHIPDMHILGNSCRMDECIIEDFKKYMEE